MTIPLTPWPEFEAGSSPEEGLSLRTNLRFKETHLKSYGNAYSLPVPSGPETVVLDGECRGPDGGGEGVICTGDQIRVGDTIPNGDFETWDYEYTELPWPHSTVWTSPALAWPDQTKVTEAERNALPMFQFGGVLADADRAVISTANPFAGLQHMRYVAQVGGPTANRKRFGPNTGWWCAIPRAYNLLRCVTGNQITLSLRHMTNTQQVAFSTTYPLITLTVSYSNQFGSAAVSGGAQAVGSIDLVPTSYTEFSRTWTVPASNLSTTVWGAQLIIDYQITPWTSTVETASQALVLDIDNLSVTVT